MGPKLKPARPVTEANLRPAMRHLPILLALVVSGGASAQELPTKGTALSFSRSISAPFNAVQFHDRALDAWTWTFGKEPGAKLLRSDRESGSIEGTARINFRSVMLTAREESMGTIGYSVQIHVRAGECRVSITNLSHTGNRSTTSGGVHVKQLMRVDTDANRVTGVGRSNAVRLHAELRETAERHITSVLQAFEWHIRTRSEP